MQKGYWKYKEKIFETIRFLLNSKSGLMKGKIYFDTTSKSNPFWIKPVT